ncbi:MAG: hypothetical protein U5L02_16445 [Rheinheimera sp.]|nr:hypothetical protein [Rheinheimera sp.]
MSSIEQLNDTLQLLAKLSAFAVTQKNPREALIKEFEKHGLCTPALSAQQLEALDDAGLLLENGYPRRTENPAWVQQFLNQLYFVYSAPSARAYFSRQGP